MNAALIIIAMSICIILAVLSFYLLSLGKYKDTIKSLNKKNYAFFFMLPAGLYFMEKIKYAFSNSSAKLRQSFAELYGEKNAKYYLKIHTANKFATAMLCLFLVSLFSLFISVQSLTGVQKKPLASMNGNVVTGPEFNPGANDNNGNAAIRVEAEIRANGSTIKKSYDISPNTRLPDDKTCVGLTVKDLEDKYIAVNKAVFESGVSSNLNFTQFGNQLGCNVILKTDPGQAYLSDKGEYTQPGPELAEPLGLSAVFIVSKGDVTGQTDSFSLKISPVITNPADELDQIVREANSQNNGVITLPQTVGKAAVMWSQVPQPPDNTKYIVFIGGIFVTALLIILLDSNVDKSIKQKRERIKRDFPDFVNKYVLLLGCGLTSYDAFYKILEDNRNIYKSLESHPIYMELETTLREIDLGKAEVHAYEDFGLRCRITEAMKFSSLVAQNLRRGTNDLLVLLKEQVSDVWQVHKADIRRRGEEAGTYLVFPMILSLVSVLLVVIYPAFVSVKL